MTRRARGRLLRVGVISDTHGLDAVISGHSHAPHNERRHGVLFFNPGSAGPRRFRLPITVGRLRVRGADLEAEIVTLAVFSRAV